MYVYVYVYIYCIYIYIHANIYLRQYINQLISGGAQLCIYLLVIKHGLLENPPFSSRILARNLHLVWGFPSWRCLITRGQS